MALLATLSVASGVFAEPSPQQRAKELDKAAGELARDKHDVRGALALYEQALALAPTPERTCNVGMAHYQLDALPSAHFFLAQCLGNAGRLPAASVENLSKAYAYVDRQLQAGSFAQVKFSSTLEGVEVQIPALGQGAAFPLPRSVWLPLGEQTYRASAEGYQTQSKTVSIKAANKKNRQAVSIILEEVVVPKRPTVEHTKTPLIDASSTPITSRDTADSSSRLPAWIGLSTGAGLMLVGGVFHLRAAGVRSDLEGVPSGDSRRSLIEDLKRERTFMGGFYGAGVLALGLGTILMLSGDDSEPKKHPAIGFTFGSQSIAFGGAF
jgi:hypothetical protein